MSIRDLMDQFEIQGKFEIKTYDDDYDDVVTLAKGNDFECERHKIRESILDAEILYLYSANGMLNIEIKGDEKDD